MDRIANAIVTRLLTCKSEGQEVEVTVNVGCPVEEQDGWVCEYGVIFTGNRLNRIHKIIGEDSMQALQLAIMMLGSTVLSLEGTSDWRWNGEPYIGLPSSTKESLFGSMP